MIDNVRVALPAELTECNFKEYYPIDTWSKATLAVVLLFSATEEVVQGEY